MNFDEFVSFYHLEGVRDYIFGAHRSINQTRKYSGKPYEVHLDDVARIVYANNPSIFQVVLAWAHDYAEDVIPVNPDYTYATLNEVFHRNNLFACDNLIMDIKHVTNFFTKEKFPNLDRRTRATLEAGRLATILPGSRYVVHTLKYADILSNTKNILEEDINFAKVYVPEKVIAVEVMREGHQKLRSRVIEQLNTLTSKLGL